MPLGETFDLGRAYSQAQGIKESKQIMELRGLQLEELKKPKKMSFDDSVGIARLHYAAAVAGAADPSDTNIVRQAEMLKKAGALEDDFDVGELLALPPEQRQAALGDIAKGYKTWLDAADPPRESGVPAPSPEFKRYNELYPEMVQLSGGVLVAKDREHYAEFLKKEKPESAEGKETYTNDPKQFVKVNGKWMRPGNRGGFARVPEGFEPPEDPGSDSTAPESLIWRQVVNTFGGMYDPSTGEFTITDPKARPRAQQVAATASRIYKDGKGSITPSEAVARALGQKEKPAEEPGGLPQEAVSRLKPGVITTFANGQKWTIRDGKPVQVQ